MSLNSIGQGKIVYGYEFNSKGRMLPGQIDPGPWTYLNPTAAFATIKQE